MAEFLSGGAPQTPSFGGGVVIARHSDFRASGQRGIQGTKTNPEGLVIKSIFRLNDWGTL